MKNLFNPHPVSLSFGILFFRSTIGLMMLIGHGMGKLDKLIVEPDKFVDPLGLGVTISLVLVVIGEVLIPFFIVIGFMTRFSTLYAAVVMAVAAFVFHAPDPYAKKEMAILYLVPFLVLFLIGSGRWSIDHYIFNREKKYGRRH